MSIQLRNGLANQSVDLVLEDLLVRFLVNVPDEDLSSIERVFFQVEEAQWFYTDFIRQLNPTLPGMKIKSFSTKFLEKCPLIWKWGDPSDAISRFGKYKSTIPVRGVALFNKDLTKVVLVKGTDSNTWSFPRGKISKDESDIDCAVREVEEETGFNAKDLVNENDVIERTIKGKNYKIYLVKNVPEDFNFQPLARNEISKIQWHDIKTIQKKSRSNPNNYFIVATILKPMLRWININKGILNEEELMFRAEIKLKELLGINQPKQENVDAGRELLNILQGVVPKTGGSSVPSSMETSQNLIQMNLPQHLHNQIPFFTNAPTFPQAYQFHQPIIVPGPYIYHSAVPQMTPVQSHPRLANSSLDLQRSPSKESYIFNQQPNPQSLQKPTSMINRRSSEANSKELLSILNMKSTKKVQDSNNISSDSNSIEITSNRSKAKHLLNLFNKQKEKYGENSESKDKTAIEEESSPQNGLGACVGSHQPSNELEESLRSFNGLNNRLGHLASAEGGKKLTLLKRSEKQNAAECDTKETSDLSHLLGNPPKSSKANKPEAESILESAAEPVNKPQGTSTELFDLLKGNKKETSKESANTSASLELLGILNKNKITMPERPENDERSTDNTEADSQFKARKDNFENFDNFEDFEDFSEQFSSTSKSTTYHNFDVASDEDEIENLIDEFSESYISDMPISSKNNPSNPIESFASNKQNKTIKKGKIRLLKPGESLNDLLGNSSNGAKQGKKNVEEENTTSQQGQSLLQLLNGGKKSNNNLKATSQKNDFSSIYGDYKDNFNSGSWVYGQNEANLFPSFRNTSASQDQPSVSFEKKPRSTSNQAAASLLSLLNKKPSLEQSKCQGPESLTLNDLENNQFNQSNTIQSLSPQNFIETDTTKLMARSSTDKHSSARDLLNILKGGGNAENDSSASFHPASSHFNS